MTNCKTWPHENKSQVLSAIQSLVTCRTDVMLAYHINVMCLCGCPSSPASYNLSSQVCLCCCVTPTCLCACPCPLTFANATNMSCMSSVDPSPHYKLLSGQILIDGQMHSLHCLLVIMLTHWRQTAGRDGWLGKHD